MRVLRTSAYINAYAPPLTAVMRECDMRDTVDSTIHQLLEPGVLVLSDVFEAANTTGIEEATERAMQRWEQEREKHMAMLYHWCGEKLLILNPGGTLLMDKPTPLDSESMRVALDQLAQHPNYDAQTVIGYDCAGKEVKLEAGSTTT